MNGRTGGPRSRAATRRLGAAALAAAAFTALSGGTGAVEAQVTEEFRWSGTLAAGQTLEVNGLSGGIRATPATGRQVEVVATKRSRRGARADLARVEVQVLEHAGGITVCAVYPGASGGRGDRCPTDFRGERGSTDVEVDFEVRVPSGVRFVGKSVNGAIEARDLSGEAALSTVNGAIEVSTSGRVSAETVNGAIRATIGRLDPGEGGGLSFKTVNGAVSVTLPADAGARVTLAAVNGELRSDFPLTIPAGSRLGSRRAGPRKLEGTIGEGGPSVELRTVNGMIELRSRG